LEEAFRERVFQSSDDEDSRPTSEVLDDAYWDKKSFDEE
jgi:hypothetical protein